LLEQRGKKTKGFLNILRKVDGTWVAIPLFVIIGVDRGPVLLVDGCHHGDEYEGAEAIISVANFIEPSMLKGTLIAVPAVNLDAFTAGARVSPSDYSHADLNRSYPGKTDGYITPRIADFYKKTVISKVDYAVSLHGGGNVLHLEPLAGYQCDLSNPELESKSRAMASAFGVSILWRMEGLPFTGVMSEECKKMGIPAITPEVGSHSHRYPGRRDDVYIVEQGIFNVLEYLEMIDEKTIADKRRTMKGRWPSDCGLREDMTMTYIHGNHGGLHIPLMQMKAEAKQGDILSEVRDIFGELVDIVKAPFDGVVMGYWSYPVLPPGNWAYMLGRRVGKR
jgi:predicted deacylase